MCGIVALFTPVKDGVARVERALQSMAHRGLPGRMGIKEAGFGVLLGHVRLPIVGLDRRYDQPWEEEHCTLAFAGEIHNYKEIMPTAECDVQVLVPRWRHGLHNGWVDFDGFWQIAMVDRHLGVGVLAVDYLAQKPLYMYSRDGVVAAASEPAALAAFGPLTLDQKYLSNVAKWGYDPTGRTPYLEVTKLDPGVLGVVALANPQAGFGFQDYYPLPAQDDVPPAVLRAQVELAVNRRLVSDVPVACLVSGGLDSAIVALTAQKLGADVHAFHVENDEGDYARMVAEHGGFQLTQLPTFGGWEDAAELAMQEPVDLGSVYPQFCLGMGLHERGYRVCLSGDGADELFGGYRRAQDYDSQFSDVYCELVHYHLPKLDRTMMASTVELRSPFLAPYVARAAFGLPWARRKAKDALKEAFADLLPSAILDREKKPLRGHDPYDQQIRNQIIRRFVEEHRRLGLAQK